jgi:hypothetical protein
MQTVLDWIAQIVRIAMLRTERTALRGLWRLLYEAVIRSTAAYLRRGRPHVAVYVRRSLGIGEPVAGLSDMDLSLVVPTDPRGPGVVREEMRRRWRRARRRLGLLGKAIDLGVYEDRDLERVLDAAPAHLQRQHIKGSPERDLPPIYFGPQRPADYYGLTIRPGLYGPTADWRLVAGPERRPPEPPASPDYRRLAAWLELQYWWRQAYDACSSPRQVDSAYLCFKIVAESARAWLWLAHDERVARPRDALERMGELLSEEQPALLAFLELRRMVGSSPSPPLGGTLDTLRRISARIAGLLAEDAEGHMPVRLLGAEGPGAVVPFCDWRWLVFPTQPDEVLAIVAGDPGDPSSVAAAATLDGDGVQPAFVSGDLLILPGRVQSRGWFRAIQCPATDPVTFALLAGGEIAFFPALAGLSASDTADRAVAEHAGWLSSGRHPADERGLAALFSAARAALFRQALDEGVPVLPLTVEATALLLAEACPGARAAAVASAAACLEARSGGRAPPPDLVSALAHHVRRLPAYAAGPASRTSSRSSLSAMRAQS